MEEYSGSPNTRHGHTTALPRDGSRHGHAANPTASEPRPTTRHGHAANGRHAPMPPGASTRHGNGPEHATDELTGGDTGAQALHPTVHGMAMPSTPLPRRASQPPADTSAHPTLSPDRGTAVNHSQLLPPSQSSLSSHPGERHWPHHDLPQDARRIMAQFRRFSRTRHNKHGSPEMRMP